MPSEPIVRESLRALLSDVLDYAGMFPPARLALEPALENYRSYLVGPDSWMLARFLCPATNLSELSARLDGETCLRVSVIARVAEERARVGQLLSEDLYAVAAFIARAASRAEVESIERRGPAACIPSLPETLSEIAAHTSGQPVAGQAWRLFLEVPLREAWRDELPQALRAIRDQNEQAPAGAARGSTISTPRPAVHGFKLRCGGADSSAVPTPEQVARVIACCRDADVPLKLTAGLHHPIRHFDAGLMAHVHGFLNVLGAAVLADALRLDVPDIQAIIEEQDLRQFTLTDSFFGWNDAEATLSEIRFARQRRIMSFGSCSFDEPREDLRRLRVL
jgi:hypothetical protein